MKVRSARAACVIGNRQLCIALKLVQVEIANLNTIAAILAQDQTRRAPFP